MIAILKPLSIADFRWLFLGQLVSLIGTGLTTVALALLAFDLNPSDAGLVLGFALAIKMVAYLTVAPVVGGYAHRLPRKAWLAGLNIGRAMLVGVLPFCDEVWQLFVVIFLLNALAAGYTPVYQALLPDILPKEKEYTQALSLSRLAMEMESLLSPALAAFLLLFVSYDLLFQLNSVAFLLASIFLLLVSIPVSKGSDRSGGVWQHVSFGIKSYLRTPRLRGVLLLNLALSAAGAMIIVNTVVYVRAVLGLAEEMVPLLMVSAGVGSMIVAFMLPALLERFHDRSVMLAGGGVLSVSLFLGLLLGLLGPSYLGLFPLWFMIGVGSTMILIPTGRVVRNSCQESDRNDYFSANFALTHGMWLVGYLLAGSLGSTLGMEFTFVVLAAVALLATVLAAVVWKQQDHHELWHEHPEMDHLHPHYHDEHHQHEHEGWEGPEPHVHPHYHAKQKHRHKFVIDEHHAHWPKQH
ncbi:MULTISPECIES: MFS transporter [unclassified Neptuniibacter]|uniref:MFS transporter n=1 Tax=unclassified Neptuniibacter TaxID=2630693 RepID=UPI000C4ED1D6|nr:MULTISPECIES: MFS transporter [unclassified Neptuniibacter]MAY42921.1 MFS transporter [Oceanospirillaceae bacterium]|tara:strand:- start:4916 stop:6313 length:1398 start_codon:yes stop_codon:yes gene_type:complete